MRSLSIKWRLALQFTLVVFLMLFIAGTAVFVLFTNRERQDSDTLLYVQSASLKSSLPITIEDIAAPDWRNQMYRKIDAVKALGFLVVITDSEGHVIDHSSTQQVLPPMSGYSTTRIDDNQYRVYRTSYGPYVIVIGRALDAILEAERALLSILLLTLVASLVAAISLSAMFAGRALQPLTRFSRKIREIDPKKIPASFEGTYVDDEIGQLARTFDDFLRRLDRTFKRERQFTQDASHELRTPLMVMKSSLELIEANGRELTTQQKEKIALMQGAMTRMETLVDELLVLSRGLQHAKKQDIALDTFLEEFVKSFRVIAEDKGLRFSLTTGKKPASLNTHKTALEKVIGNLIRNAIRFTKAGSVSVSLEGKTLTVTDTGVGIVPPDLPHIFERFYRGDSSRNTEGTGLGLAICKNICEEEGWQIRIESEVGKGSMFTVKF